MNKVIVRISIILTAVFLLRATCSATEITKIPSDPNYIKFLEYGSQGKFEDAEKELKLIKAKQYEMLIHINLNVIKSIFDKKITEQTAMHLFNGSYYLEKGETKKAIAELNEAIAANPNYSETYRKMGIAYSADGKFGKAISELTKAIKIDPMNEYLYFTRGSIYFKDGYYSKASDDHTKAIEIAPNNAKFYEQRAVCYYMKGKYDKVIDDFSKAISIDHSDPNVYIQRGVAYSMKKQYNKAKDDFEKAMKIDPINSFAYLNRGILNFVALNDDAACTDFKTAIKLKLDNILAYLWLADTYYRQHDYDKTWETVNKILELKGKVNPSFLDKLKKESGREK
ncbi:MAG: tetratricopeptide repeat protein [Candidatus Omnitrophica bacterium]|nr:tetratricopeptide repeat protein [Candidatus Omnitrophota bacterium]